MMNNNPYRKYQKTQVTTASREKILLMLYEGAIRFVKQAKAAMAAGKIAEKGTYVSKATAILSELMATLDFKVGGELAADLENLYVFMIDKLIEGNIQNDPECFDNVENLLMTLYQAWKDVVENLVRTGFLHRDFNLKNTKSLSQTKKVKRKNHS